jgi:hypothetical protein
VDGVPDPIVIGSPSPGPLSFADKSLLPSPPSNASLDDYTELKFFRQPCLKSGSHELLV